MVGVSIVLTRLQPVWAGVRAPFATSLAGVNGIRAGEAVVGIVPMDDADDLDHERGWCFVRTAGSVKATSTTIVMHHHHIFG